MLNTRTGGKAIAAGGFGCVFRPSLKCNDPEGARIKSSQADKMVSKLMAMSDAKDEYNELGQFMPSLEKIANYRDYFLLPSSLCSPSQLTSSDLVDFNSKCTNLAKRGINESNVNSQLDKLMMIQLYNGGEDLEKYIHNGMLTLEKVGIINNEIIRLLVNAIKPMNHQNIYHFDLKSANVMVNNENIAKIIDFGLSIEIPNTKVIPEKACYRPIQYNLPYMNILFNNEFINGYKKYLKTNPVPTKDNIYVLLQDLYHNTIINQTGDGHHGYIVPILKKHILQLPIAYNKDPVFEYVVDTLYHYTNNGKVAMNKIFEHFLHNSDIFGLLSCYIDIVEDSGIQWQSATLRDNVISEVRTILKDEWYASSSKMLVVNDIVTRINRMNRVLGVINKKRTSTSEKVVFSRKRSRPISESQPTNPPTRMISIIIHEGISDGSPASTAAYPSSRRRSRTRSSNRTITMRKSSAKQPKPTKRCPNGTRRNKITGICEPYRRK